MNEYSNLSSFTNELANKYTAMYDVYRDEKLAEFYLPFYAIYRRRDERYMISKKIKVYGVENQQIVFTTLSEDLSTEFIHNFQSTIEEEILTYIPEDNEHMSTIVLGIVITNQDVNEKIVKEVRRYRKIKFIKYGLHGWLEIYSVLINLKDDTIHVHPKGKPFVQSIQKLLKEEEVTK